MVHFGVRHQKIAIISSSLLILILVVDCAEGTLRQFALQDRRFTSLRVNNVSKMFLTHMHGGLAYMNL